MVYNWPEGEKFESDATDIAPPCKNCREESFGAGDGLCYECFKEKLTEAILRQSPIVGPETLKKIFRGRPNE